MEPQIIAALIAAISAVVIAIINVIITVVNNIKNRAESKKMQEHNKKILDLNEALLQEQRIVEKRKGIYKILNEFYGPLIQHLNRSNELYKLFRVGKDSFKDPKETEFRTLTALLRGVVFNGNDKTLLEDILQTGANIRTLIESKSGLIDDSHLVGT